MNKSSVMWIATLLALGVAGCSSNRIKEPHDTLAGNVEAAYPQANTQPSNSAAVTQKTAPVGKASANPLQDPASILSKRTIHFDFDQFEVKDASRDLVEAHANYLTNNRGAIVVLEGNADERGSREYNLALGQKRAEAVRKLMHVNGVTSRQIETISYGEEWPVSHGHDEEAWQKNRRVFIRYVGE